MSYTIDETWKRSERVMIREVPVGHVCRDIQGHSLRVTSKKTHCVFAEIIGSNIETAYAGNAEVVLCSTSDQS